MKTNINILFFLVILAISCDKNDERHIDILDTSFNTGTGLDSPYAQIHCLSILPNGKIIVAGNFTLFNQTKCNMILKLSSNGTIDHSFKVDSMFNWTFVALGLQQDGKIVVGGAGGTSPNYICRLNSNGTIDPAFYSGIGFNWSINSLAIQSDGKIIAGGGFTSFNGISQNFIARLNSDGTRDDSFNIGSGFNDTVGSVLLQNDGKILVCGFFTSYNGIDACHIARLNNDGSIDNTFKIGGGFSNDVFTMKVQSDGNILVGGSFSEYNGVAQNKITRLQVNGTIDENFKANLPIDGEIVSIEVQKDKKILISGRFTYTSDQVCFKNIERLNPDGTLDKTYKTGNGFDNTVYSMSLQDDDKLICVGGFRYFNGTTCHGLARLNKD